jgi:hydroxymethylpyrimidine pyrophosphatase-like HAD family hydrolase
MNPSDNILKRIRMFVTDADGTLMGRRPEFDQYRAFRTRIASMRAASGVAWVVCTGRSLHGYRRIFRPMNMFGITPDYVIARHAYIYECKSWGYMPHWLWNLRVLQLQWREEAVLRRVLPRLRRAVLSTNPFAKVACSSRQRLCFRFDDEGAAKFGAEILREGARPYKYLQIFESPNEVDIRVIPFTKGLAVTELARHLGVNHSEILVVGDGHNDISMMEMSPPCFTACPANAATEVVETVHKTHGHIASEPSLTGVLEVLSAYESGKVNDQLPVDWVGRDAPLSSPHAARGIVGGLGTTIMLLAVLYMTLLAVANFCPCPGREVILKPYVVVVEKIAGILETFRK